MRRGPRVAVALLVAASLAAAGCVDVAETPANHASPDNASAEANGSEGILGPPAPWNASAYGNDSSREPGAAGAGTQGGDSREASGGGAGRGGGSGSPAAGNGDAGDADQASGEEGSGGDGDSGDESGSDGGSGNDAGSENATNGPGDDGLEPPLDPTVAEATNAAENNTEEAPPPFENATNASEGFENATNGTTEP